MKAKYEIPFTLQGKLSYRLRSLMHLYESVIVVTLRRFFKGALRPGWSLTFEMSVYFLKKQTSYGFTMKNINDSREYEDALLFKSPARLNVKEIHISGEVRGDWVIPNKIDSEFTILYLHGGGYAYYSGAHKNMIALIANALKVKMFALDYRLIPEHPFPAQLDDSVRAYDWLTNQGINANKIVLMGDSAGGNLTLSLLLKLRSSGRFQPALAVCIAPWTDIANGGKSLYENEKYDWVDSRMPVQWAKWFIGEGSADDPEISPLKADLRNLSPIYIQDGDAEILHDMITAFYNEARKQGADIELVTWPNMIHDFHAFGDLLPESKEALGLIAKRIQRLQDVSV